MKPVDFRLQCPESLTSSIAKLAEPNTQLMAGGQSLMPMLNLRLARPEQVLDIHALEELREVQEDGDTLLYGAAITHAMFEDGRVPDATPGWLARIAAGIAYRAVRNRGTIGGSLAHADPAADWLSSLTALGADVVLTDGRERRRTPLAGFVRSAFTTARLDGEILTHVAVPKRGTNARFGYWKFCRKTGEFAKAIGAVLIDPDRSEKRAVLGALERAPIVINDLDELLDDPRSAKSYVRQLLPQADRPSSQLYATALERAARMALA